MVARCGILFRLNRLDTDWAFAIIGTGVQRRVKDELKEDVIKSKEDIEQAKKKKIILPNIVKAAQVPAFG